MDNRPILILAAPHDTSNIVYNSISSHFTVAKVVMEGREDKVKFIKRRIRRLGLITVAGQILFQFSIGKILPWLSKKRISQIIRENNLNLSSIPANKILQVDSVNDERVLSIIKEINPALIIVNGTRIISNKILKNISCNIINTHAGITPKYRGVHGAYWAMVNGDAAHNGVTVHYVNAGIDTGDIIYQSLIKPAANDNFSTYPYLQIAEGIKILHKAVEDILNSRGELLPNPTAESNLYYHPTIWQYIYYRLTGRAK
ncbi:MAG: formyl transferase [Ferruginibacter sp.]